MTAQKGTARPLPVGDTVQSILHPPVTSHSFHRSQGKGGSSILISKRHDAVYLQWLRENYPADG